MTSMDIRHRAIIAYLGLQITKKKKKNRRYWVHPIASSRLSEGTFYVLFYELRDDENKFFDYFKMSIKSYDELHHTLKNILQKKDTNMRLAIPPIEMLAMTLR